MRKGRDKNFINIASVTRPREINTGKRSRRFKHGLERRWIKKTERGRGREREREFVL